MQTSNNCPPFLTIYRTSPTSEPPTPEHSDELRAELDALLEQEITDENLEEHLKALEGTQSSVHRLEHKLNQVERLPE